MSEMWRHADGSVRVDHMDAQPGDYFGYATGPEPDAYGRTWPQVPDAERCRTCGQPDNCGDCNHTPLTDAEVVQLGGRTP